MQEEGKITLDLKRGINPRLTTCTRCGGESNDLLLLGDQDYSFFCKKCNRKYIGRAGSTRCPMCKGFDTKHRGRLGEYEKIPYGLCDACKKKDEECAEVVKDGGVFWRCRDCHSAGAIRKDAPIAKAVRAQLKIDPPDPVGVEFTKEDCPVCPREEQTGQTN